MDLQCAEMPLPAVGAQVGNRLLKLHKQNG